jgi:hypothetical protein
MKRPYTHIEPRTQVSDAALARGDRNAWRQVLGLPPAIPYDAIGRRKTGDHTMSPPKKQGPDFIPPGDLEDAVGTHEQTDFGDSDADDEDSEDSKSDFE